MWEKFKSCLANDAVFYGILLIGVGIASFGLGRQSVLEGDIVKNALNQADLVEVDSMPLVPPPTPTIPTSAPVTLTETVEEGVVASKSGTKYHLPTCSGAKSIKPENLISFASVAAAEAAGYTPAANCKGLQ
ncbi:MAG: hypothetical protein KBB78_03465 [Candidatus Pacebacteria bacterium]|nr:hypothetical protein [Candidatus Paceibacterota bacterium]